MAIQRDVERHLQIRAGGGAVAPMLRAGRTVGRSDAEGPRGPRLGKPQVLGGWTCGLFMFIITNTYTPSDVCLVYWCKNCGLWLCVTIVTIAPSFVYQLSYWELWGSCKCWAIFFVKQHSETSENKNIGLGQFGFFCASGSSFTWGDPSISQRLEKGHLWAQTYYGLSQGTRYDFCVRPPKSLGSGRARGRVRCSQGLLAIVSPTMDYLLISSYWVSSVQNPPVVSWSWFVNRFSQNGLW